MSETSRTGRADDAFRLRRADRRAQCRQVDAGQPAGRHQGVDRHPQGADDARHRPRHRHAPQRADRASLDTPGIFKPRRALDRAMVTTAWGGAKDADIVLVLIDAERGIKGDADSDPRQPRRTCASRRSWCSTRSTRSSPESLLTLTTAANARADFARTFMVSALTGSGCARPARLSRRGAAGRPLVLSRGSGLRPADAPARRRDHPRKALSAPASGTALFLACRDREVGGEEGRLGAHRAGDLCRARQPEEDRARPQGRDDPRDRPGVAAWRSPRSSNRRCICSCS